MISATIPLCNKVQVLQNTANTLKKEFVGLDLIIDQIIKLITPWYLYPQHQKRPLVINLWGMTGVGKTSLVKRIVKCLHQEEHFYLFDMGANNPSIDTLKTFFKMLFEKDNSFPFILGLDEFQYANTKHTDGVELEKTYSRVIWELLDTGRFQVFRERFHKVGLSEIISELKYLLKKGVRVHKGVVVDNINYYLNVISPEKSILHGGYDTDDALVESYRKENNNLIPKRLLFIKDSALEEIFRHCSDLYEHRVELRDQLMQLNGYETIQFLESAEQYARSRKEIDASKALVFIMGNLDEAYEFSNVINPDISANEFYKRSKQITIQTIKKALQIRFTNEQIGRLGNNHIIYPALSKKAYEQIIVCELEKLSSSFDEGFNIKIEFQKSIKQLLYREGVYPTQGTRPLISTIQNLIETNLSLIPGILEREMISPDRIIVKVVRNSLIFQFLNDAKLIFNHTEKLSLHLNEVRRSKNDELQAVTAVHESGHAIASALIMQEIPLQILSVSSDPKTAGMVITGTKERMVWGKQYIIQKAAVLLAGLCAETIVFGDENITAGSQADIRTATQLINKLIKKQGMGGHPYCIETKDTFGSNGIYDEGYEYNSQIKILLNEANVLAKTTLESNKTLFIQLSHYLSSHSSISRQCFIKLLGNYKSEESKVAKFNYRKVLEGYINNL